MDNLQSVTYQTFEQDPVKYRHYEEVDIVTIVVGISLTMRPCKGNLSSSGRVAWWRACVSSALSRSDYMLNDVLSTFCIAGAGRGPLISRCLTAIERVQRDAIIYAVEKNPNAFVTCVSSIANNWS